MSFVNLQTVEELLPFAENVERKALPEVIAFLNHCLSVAPQWMAKDTDLVKARQLLVGSTVSEPSVSKWRYSTLLTYFIDGDSCSGRYRYRQTVLHED